MPRLFRMFASKDGQEPPSIWPFLNLEFNILGVRNCVEKQLLGKRYHVKLCANAVRSECILYLMVIWRGEEGEVADTSVVCEEVKKSGKKRFLQLPGCKGDSFWSGDRI